MKMQQIHIRLPKNQIEWLDAQKGIYGSRALVIRIAIDEMINKSKPKKVKK